MHCSKPRASSPCRGSKKPFARLLGAALFLFAIGPARAETAPEGPPPLAFDHWAGPYKNAAGEEWTERVNTWWREGTAAGLKQDAFRSFDDNHSRVRAAYCPQMRFLPPVTSYLPPVERVLEPGVTFGVQSYGASAHRLAPVTTACTFDVLARAAVEAARDADAERAGPLVWPRLFAVFAERNFLLAAPAIGSHGREGDHFAFLSPYYLASVGASASDARLLKPIIMASAALPPAVKSRAIEEGVYTPLRMYLFKNSVTGDIRDAAAHRPAYELPEEAEDDHAGPAPFLKRIISQAHGLAHVPPVARIAVRSVEVGTKSSQAGAADAYVAPTPSALFIALRRGQTLVANLDVSPSWRDREQPIADVFVKLIGGAGEVEYLNENKTAFRLTVPWRAPSRGRAVRTDFLILIRDTEYWSAPAYASVWSLPDSAN